LTVRALGVVCVAALLIAMPLRAQQLRMRPYGEIRGDGIFGRPDAAQLGAGVQLPLGSYARLGLIVGGGTAWSDDIVRGSARADALMRFLLDPFRENKLGISAGAGISVRYDEGYGWRPFLLVALDIEGRKRGAITPALQVGLGGGTRVGVVLRTSPRAYR